MKKRILFVSVLMCVMMLIGSLTLWAAGAEEKTVYPEREITVIIPWAAGGGTDLIGRQIASFMQEELGVPVVVVNKTGGGGAVGFMEIATAKPDGYTIGVTSTSQILQKFSSTTFVDMSLMAPIALINEDPASLTVNANSPWNTLSDFIAAAKKDPGGIRVSNSGPGAIWHVAAMAFEKAAGIRLTHVPYEGGNPAAVACAGGHVEATTVSPAECAALVDAGKLKILAIPSVARQGKFPKVPTFKEAGLDFTFGTWRAFAAPKGTPAEVIAVLEAAIKKAIESPDYIKFMENGGFGMRYMGSSDLQKYWGSQEATFAELFKEIDMKK